MISDSREEDALRAVSLDTARSVFLARQRAEEELERTREQLRAQAEWHRVTLASIGDAVLTTDTDGRVLNLNSVAETLTGWTQADAVGKPLDEVFVILNEETRSSVESPGTQALREGRVVGLANHTILVARDGTERAIDDSAAPIRDDKGRVLGVVLVFRSIAERKEAEKALRENERELSDFFENASVGLHWVGPDGTILRVNRAELDLLGYKREEYIGHNISEFHVDQDVIGDIMRRLGAHETLRDYEARMRCKDGSIKHVLVDSSVFWASGQFIHTRCFTRDITDRKRAEDAQTRFGAIVEFSQDAILSKTPDGRILSWNAGAAHLFGYSAAEIIGQEITVLVPSERQDEEAVILERLRRGERIESYETVRLAKDGRRLDVSLTISPIRDSSGRITALSSIARDVTARRRAARRLALQNRVAQTLAESSSLEAAAPQILQHMCEQLEWQVGALWIVKDRELACVDLYHLPGVEVPRFEAASRERVFAKGTGLPGRVWKSAKPEWIPGVEKNLNVPRAPLTVAEKLHGGFAIPIILNDEVLGVIEFLSPEIHEPDEDLLDLMAGLGSQIGQFIERRRVEAVLRESEERFRTLADNAPVLIWLNSVAGNVFVNRSYLDFLGLAAPDVEGMKWSEYVHKDDFDDYIGGYLKAVERRSVFEGEFRFRRADGTYRNMKSVGVPRFSAGGEFLGYIGSSYDITDIKRTETTTRFLADASATLADLTDYESTLQKVASLAVPHFADWCAVDVNDGDDTLRRLAVAHINPEKIELVRELEREFPIQQSHSAAWRVSRTGQSEWAASIPDELLVAVSTSEHQLRIIRDLGLRSYICVPLKSRTHVIGALTFVTAESARSYDAHDVRAAEDLAHRATIAIENANLLARLKESDRQKDEFLAMLAHELRNPLAPIRNAVEILRFSAPSVPELQRATDLIERQTLQMTRLVDDLLDVSRITRGKIELRKERVALAAVVSDAVEICRPLIESRGHRLTVTLPSEPVHLEVDPTRLAQVVSNLLNNAAKYTNQGGTIAVSAEREGDTLILRVSDNGIGLPAAMRERIFDLFMQVDRSVERSEGGLGIGLTLVKQLVEMHAGSVEAQSPGPAMGSEFVVRLPLPEPAKRDQRPASVSDVRTQTPVPRRVLVVDNNRDAADSLGMLLSMMGNHVQTAYDGLDAVTAAMALQPDVIFLDIGLPNLNGYEVARRIRGQEMGHRTLIIAVTGWGQEEDRRHSLEAGFDEHLTKPVAFAAVQRVLAEAGKRVSGK